MSTKKMERSDYSLDKFPYSGNLSEKIKFVLALGSLAPSTHNIQPWIFKVNNDCCTLSVDSKLSLPEADVQGRDAYISLGCCAENIILASSFFGIFDKLEDIFSGGDVIKIYFKEGGTPKKELLPFVESIGKRFDARGKFDDFVFDDEYLKKVLELNDNTDINLNIYTGWEDKNFIANLTTSGFLQAHSNKKFRRELASMINNGLSKRNFGIPTSSMRIPFGLSFFVAPAFYLFNISKLLAKPNSSSLKSAGAIAVLSSDDTEVLWFQIGRIAQKIMLYNFCNDVKNSIFVASVEIGDNNIKLQNNFNLLKKPQFVFCFGKMKIKHKEVPRADINLKILYE